LPEAPTNTTFLSGKRARASDKGHQLQPCVTYQWFFYVKPWGSMYAWKRKEAHHHARLCVGFCTTLVLLRKTLGRALDCFLLGSLGFPFLRMHAKTNFFQKIKNKKKICLL